MTGRRIGVVPIAEVLLSLAASEGLIPDAHDRYLLGTAADVAANRAAHLVEVMVVAPNADPVVNEVLEARDGLDRIAAHLAAMRDQLEDVLTTIAGGTPT